MKVITLRIKKKFFDLIKGGEKKEEYRAYNDYFKRVFKEKSKVGFIIFHYQSKEVKPLLVEVKKISVVKNPGLKLVATEKVFKITLGKVY